MKQNNFIKLLFWSFIMTCGIVLASAVDAAASHFRYGNITWRRDMPNNPNRVIFTITQSFRSSYYGTSRVTPGSIISDGYFYAGNGYNSSLRMTVTSVNTVEDWFMGEATIAVDYDSIPANYTAYFSSCCRIGTLSNNANGSYQISTNVTVGNSNDAPVVSLPPYLNIAVGQSQATYQLAANDPNGDPLVYSMTPNGGFGAGSVQSNLVSVSPSGLLSINTQGLNIGRLINTNVTITDSKGATVMTDFIIKITETSTPPVFNYGVTPANSFVYKIAPNDTLSINVEANDADAGNIVSISAVGVPVGAAYSNASGNPATGSFSWVPTLNNLGTYVLNFTATDNIGVSSNTIVNVVVSAAPSFVSPTPGTNSVLCTAPGTAIQFSTLARDPDTTDMVTLNVTSGWRDGMTFSNPLPYTNQATASSDFSWTPADSQWGIHSLVLSAKDRYDDSVANTIHLIVNNPPVITSSPITNVNVNALYQYTLTTSDVDAIYGDSVKMEVANLPSFLTAVDNGDGTVTISGTPTIADTGSHNILIEMQDKTNHFRGTHCGHATQIFVLEVKPCDLTTSINIDSSHNIPNHPNNTIFTGYGRQDVVLGAISNGAQPIAYLWSTGDSTQTATMEPDTTTTYTVYITDAYGCTDSAEFTIYVEDIDCTPEPRNKCHNHGHKGGKKGHQHGKDKGRNHQQLACKHKGNKHGRHHGKKCHQHENSKNNNCDRDCKHSAEYRITKVTMCHTSGRKTQEICVDIRAVAAHLAHGDKLGSCGSGTDMAIKLNETFEMNLYPNPASDNITLEFSSAINGSVKVIDALGRVVISQNVIDAQTTLDIKQLVTGVYQVIVYCDNAQFKGKFVKQ